MASLRDGSGKYCDISKKGKLIIDLDKVKDDAFMQGWLCKNVCKAIITKNSKAKTGNSEVLCKSLLTGEFSVPRKEFAKNFRDSKGGKVKIFTMRNNQEYTVWTPIQQPVFFMLLPGNCAGRIQGRTVAPGNYIAFMPNDEGNIDRNKLFVMNRNLARKVLVVPNNDIIGRHSGSGKKVSGQAHEVLRDMVAKRKGAGAIPAKKAKGSFNEHSGGMSLQEEIAMGIENSIGGRAGQRTVQRAGQKHGVQRPDNVSMGTRMSSSAQTRRRPGVKPSNQAKSLNNLDLSMEVDSGQDKIVPDENLHITDGINQINDTAVSKEQWAIDMSGGDYWCVAKLVKSGKDTPCGYVLEHDGVREQLKFSQVADVCRAGKCGNMELMEGNKFKGKGIKLKDLPLEYMD